MERSLSNYVWAKAVYDGKPTSDQTSDGAFTEITMGADTPRVLFIIHGIKQPTDSDAGTSDSTMYWQVYGSNCDSPDFTNYTEISGATHGIVTVVDSAAATVCGPYLLDVDCRKYSAGKIMFNVFSSDATALELHVVALGYGGAVNHGTPSSDTVKARA
jgi:hypothetical protein